MANGSSSSAESRKRRKEQPRVELQGGCEEKKQDDGRVGVEWIKEGGGEWAKRELNSGTAAKEFVCQWL